MFSLEQWQEIFAAIRSNRLRTFATAFGVFWGILMLVLLLGTGQGIHNGLHKSMLLDAVNSIWYIPQRTSLPYKGLPVGRKHTLSEADLDEVSVSVKGIDLMSPENSLGWSVPVRWSNTAGSFPVLGADSEYFPIKVSQEIVNGRNINRADDEDRRHVAIVGTKMVEELFPAEVDPVGEFIDIQGVGFRIVGVFLFDAPRSQNQARRIYIPFSTFQSVFNNDRSVNLFVTTTAPGVSGKQLEQDVLEVLKRRQQVHPDDDRAYIVHNQEERHQEIAGLMLAIKSFIWLVGLGTLTAGVVGVSNIMLIVVKERTHEIGIRRALGATPPQIISQIMQEAVLITVVSGYLGLLLALLLLDGLNRWIAVAGIDAPLFSNPDVDLAVALSALLVLVAAGALSGLAPAIQASRINPAAALRGSAS